MFQSRRHARTERLLPTTARNLLLGCLLPLLFLVSPAVSAAASDYQTTVEAMYLAYYGRPGDPAGVAFWAEMLENEKGNLEQIIKDFGDSDEYRDRYGHLGHTELVNNIYQQLLGRPADQGGLDFYVGKLDRREMSLASIALNIHNGVQGGDDQLIVNNKLHIARMYTHLVAANELVGYGEIADAKALLDEVTASADSVATAQLQLRKLLELPEIDSPAARQPDSDSPAARQPDSPCSQAVSAYRYIGTVSGFWGDANGLEAVLAGPGTLQVVRPDNSGCFAFGTVPPGEYAVKINADGHQAPAGRLVKFPFHAVYDAEPYAVQQVASNPFTYHWEEDQTTPAGAEYSSHVVQPRVVEFQGATVDVAGAAAAERLRQHYNVLLVGDEWSQEHSFRLLTTMESIPQDVQDPSNDHFLPASAWRLTDDFIDGDIVIDTADDGTRDITISTAAFVNAAPRIATVDGKRGVWFSRRLHHAAVRFVTDNGHDESAYERIFKERYNVTTRIDDYWSLTAPTGHESQHNFQTFHAEEILLLINMLEEMPTGMHKVKGMRYLVRRLNGLLHPLYPTAPAVAWPESQYVEFMERAFKGMSEDYMHRLILHEKAHFLWAHLFDDRLKADWIELGGWYEDASSPSGWYTSKSAEFVSAYAHAVNPNEDMAETISYFVVNPDRLRARSMAKYEFVRDRIMQGDIYVARIREDLTFKVYNLFPDYVYPGKIRAIDIMVEGAPHEEKKLTVEVELHALDLEMEGAHRGQTRIHSEIGTFFDLWLHPIDEYGENLPRDGAEESTRLRGEITLSKYVKAGYWLPEGIRLDDVAGNSRYLSAKDFGWRMYVDNPLEDDTPPEYVPGTLAMSSFVSEEDGTVQVIRVTWSFEEDTALAQNRCNAHVIANLADSYSYEDFGSHDDDDLCTVEFIMPNYMPTSTYSTVRVAMRDVAENWGEAIFTGDDATEPPASIDLVTTNPDTEPPEIDINRIWVDAEPTNPSAPNGETRVTVRVRYRDNISGVYGVWMYLRDPQGGTHHHPIYLHYLDGEDGERGIYSGSDPTEWKSFERVVILPPGSLPGIWGIAEIAVEDRAKNLQQYNFVEIVHFEVDNG